MEVRRHLVGTERGFVLAAVFAIGIAILVAATRPVLEPPFPSFVGYLTVGTVYGLPAVLVGAYGGGLLASWVVAGVPAVTLLVTAAADARGEPTLLVNPTAAGVEMVALALGLGTFGFVVGRGLRYAWAAWKT